MGEHNDYIKRKEDNMSSTFLPLKLTDITGTCSGFHSQRKFDKNDPRQTAITDALIKMIVKDLQPVTWLSEKFL